VKKTLEVNYSETTKDQDRRYHFILTT